MRKSFAYLVGARLGLELKISGSLATVLLTTVDLSDTLKFDPIPKYLNLFSNSLLICKSRFNITLSTLLTLSLEISG